MTIKTTNKYSLITVENWALYQPDKDETTNKTTSTTTNERQTNDKQTTTDEEYNKNKEEKEEEIYVSDKPTTTHKKSLIPTLEEVSAYCQERRNGIDAEKFFNFYESKGWMVGKNKMKSWKAAVITWEKNNKQNGYSQPTLFPTNSQTKKNEPMKPQVVNYKSDD